MHCSDALRALALICILHNNNNNDNNQSDNNHNDKSTCTIWIFIVLWIKPPVKCREIFLINWRCLLLWSKQASLKQVNKATDLICLYRKEFISNYFLPRIALWSCAIRNTHSVVFPHWLVVILRMHDVSGFCTI